MPELFQTLTPAEVEKILDEVETLDRDELEACIDVELYEIADLEPAVETASDPRAKRELREQVAFKLQLVDGYRAELRRRLGS